MSSTRLRINPFSGVLRADTLTDSSQRLFYNATPPPLQPRCVAAASPLRHRCNPAASHLRHRCVTSASSLRRRSAAAATPLRYSCGEIHGGVALCPSLPGNSLKLRISVVDRHEIDKLCPSLTENEIKATKKGWSSFKIAPGIRGGWLRPDILSGSRGGLWGPRGRGRR